MNPGTISPFIVFGKGDENITESMRPLLDEPIPIPDMPKLHICLSKRAWLYFPKSNLCISLKKLFQNITNIGEEYLIWVRMNGRSCPILMTTRVVRQDGPGNPSSPLHCLYLRTMRDERGWINGNVGH